VIISAALLGVIAVILAWPFPLVLARSDWPARSPDVALVLWQAIALSGGMSMIGSLLLYGLVPFGNALPQSVIALGYSLRSGTLPADTRFTHVLALGAAILLSTHLLLNLFATFVRAERQRRRHYTLIALLSDPLNGQPGMRVIDHPAPVAYCLPGAGHSATVLSKGLLRLLDADQVRAVIAHERAHLVQQHHLVLLAFKSWHSALPWFPIANRAENAVALLVEMIADDRARRDVDDRTLATAIALVGLGQQPEVLATASDGESDEPWISSPKRALVAPRVYRLMNQALPLSRLATMAVFVTAIALALAPAIVLVRA
jgi:Zn-dependent protease with chaperone function